MQSQLNSYQTGQANNGPGIRTAFIEDQGVAEVIAYPARTGTGDSPHQGFDPAEGSDEGVVRRHLCCDGDSGRGL